MTELDILARAYVDLTLIKQQSCDTWDVYWLADTPFWKRENLYVNREAPEYPYKPAPKMPRMAVGDILVAAQDLLRHLCDLRGTVGGNEAIRLEFLIEHTRSMVMRTRFLAGEKIPYDTYTSGMFGLTAPSMVDEPVDGIIAELKQVLPGRGDIGKRIWDFKESLRIPEGRVPAVMNAAASFFHRMAVEHMGVKDANMPRLRYRKYGGDRMFITILFGYDYDEVTLEQNFGSDYPFYLDSLREVAGHELEPGHFTFMSLRTKGMVDTGYPELGLNSHGPSGSFIEGGARNAIKFALDTLEKEQAYNEMIFSLAGADKALIACLPAWYRFLHVSSHGKLEIERRLWDGVWTRREAADFARVRYIIPRDAGDEAVDDLLHDEGHYTSHDYCTDVMTAYFNHRFATTAEKWQAYSRLCQYPFLMSGLVDGSFDHFTFQI